MLIFGTRIQHSPKFSRCFLQNNRKQIANIPKAISCASALLNFVEEWNTFSIHVRIEPIPIRNCVFLFSLLNCTFEEFPQEKRVQCGKQMRHWVAVLLRIYLSISNEPFQMSQCMCSRPLQTGKKSCNS